MSTLSPTHPFRGGPAQIVGAFTIEETADGAVPRRLPASTHHILDPMTQMAQAASSGVRLAFRTNSPTVELVAMPTGVRIPELGRAERDPAVDLVVDGALRETRTAKGGRVRVMSFVQRRALEVLDGPEVRFRFDGLGEGEKDVELWFQPFGEIELRDLQLAPGATLSPTDDARPRWVHYGSSISQCSEATSPARVWPAVTARLADLHLVSLGLGGSCHLDQYAARTIRDTAADVISLKLGINVVNAASMTERAFVPALHGFLDTVRDGHPATPIVLVSPIFCPAAEDRPGPTLAENGVFQAVGDPDGPARGALTLRRIREILEECVAVRRKLGDANLHYLSGLALFDEGDVADLPDGLHPNGAGYERMGERFAERVFAPGALLPASSLR